MNREPAEIDKQTVIRLNRDTLYSSAVIDLDAGPATVTGSAAKPVERPVAEKTDAVTIAVVR